MSSKVFDRKALPVKQWDDPSILVKLRWSGVNFYEFVLPNGKTIVMDPYFDDPNDAHNEYKYTQTDLPAGKKSGLAEAIQILRGIPDIGIVELTGKDIVRHELVQQIVEAYAAKENVDREGKEKP